MAENSQRPPQEQKSQGLLANLAFNIIIPTLILTKFSGEDWLGNKAGLVVALAFPVLYGLYDYSRTRKANFFSILGVFSVLLTGGISLMELDPKYIAIKEAAIPGAIGLATMISIFTPYPLVRTFLYNEQVLKVDVVAEALAEHGETERFEQRLKNATWIVAGSFFLSSVLNYILAKWILVSAPGTEAFNQELGKMTALSYPVIALPSAIVLMVALYYLMNSITKLTHLELEDVLRT